MVPECPARSQPLSRSAAQPKRDSKLQFPLRARSDDRLRARSLSDGAGRLCFEARSKESLLRTSRANQDCWALFRRAMNRGKLSHATGPQKTNRIPPCLRTPSQDAGLRRRSGPDDRGSPGRALGRLGPRCEKASGRKACPASRGLRFCFFPFSCQNTVETRGAIESVSEFSLVRLCTATLLSHRVERI